MLLCDVGDDERTHWGGMVSVTVFQAARKPKRRGSGRRAGRKAKENEGIGMAGMEEEAASESLASCVEKP